MIFITPSRRTVKGKQRVCEQATFSIPSPQNVKEASIGLFLTYDLYITTHFSTVN